MEIKVPFLSIQPLVENAVQHGLMERIDGGFIKIKVEEIDNKIKITVEDNGVGMEEGKLATIINKSTSTHAGVGLMNTNQRIKRLFGEGLTINSVKGKGTTISFFVNRER